MTTCTRTHGRNIVPATQKALTHTGAWSPVCDVHAKFAASVGQVVRPLVEPTPEPVQEPRDPYLHLPAGHSLTANDVQALRIMRTSTYSTVSVRTRRGSQYLVVTRPGYVTVVCPDGTSVKGDGAYVIGGSLYIRDDSRDVTLVRTTPIVSAYVLEN